MPRMAILPSTPPPFVQQKIKIFLDSEAGVLRSARQVPHGAMPEPANHHFRSRLHTIPPAPLGAAAMPAVEPSPLPPAVYDDLRRTLADAGPAAAAEQLVSALRDAGQYDALFYAL